MSKKRSGFTLIELLVVVVILSIVIAVLLPTLGKAKRSAMMSSMSSDMQMKYRTDASPAPLPAAQGPSSPVSSARVTSFEAQIDLKPRLSVGTAEAESIYEARFAGKVAAKAPTAAAARGPEVPLSEWQIIFPLPPQIISLSDLTFKVNGEPSDAVQMRQGALVWRGRLPETPVPIELTYTAVGKGVYSLEVPPGGKLDTFKIELASVGSDVRMLELSLQPDPPRHAGGNTHYTWNYKNLAFGRPIALDVLGIAPIDRLGELSWLGPLSVIMFGLLVGLFAHVFDVQNFDRWMLLLIIGTFTGAYPLMYFAQEYAHPTVAIALSELIVIIIIAVRAVTIMGWRHGLAGCVAPAVVVMTLTLIAALETRFQGLLLTVGGLAFFVVAMALAPRLKALSPSRIASTPPTHPSPAPGTQPQTTPTSPSDPAPD